MKRSPGLCKSETEDSPSKASLARMIRYEIVTCFQLIPIVHFLCCSAPLLAKRNVILDLCTPQVCTCVKSRFCRFRELIQFFRESLSDGLSQKVLLCVKCIELLEKRIGGRNGPTTQIPIAKTINLERMWRTKTLYQVRIWCLHSVPFSLPTRCNSCCESQLLPLLEFRQHFLEMRYIAQSTNGCQRRSFLQALMG